mmetsp:Transcript_15139/g.32113  ORF Transcript_15139/g.32113 Transcript_15139/m.32113 type:complete len:171 (-) Transcript_15139:412-924(-)
MLWSFCYTILFCRRPHCSKKTDCVEDVGGSRSVPSPGDGVTSDPVELQSLRARYQGSDDNNLLERLAELERINTDLKGQLAQKNAHNNSTANGGDDCPSNKDEIIATLRSEMETLKEEKSQVEQNLAKEIQKSKQRKEDAKKRRETFKARIEGMSETLIEDKVKRSYERE